MRIDRMIDYIEKWAARGYGDDIPDEVPDALMSECLAPSYKAIALCILRSDMAFVGLGYSARPSPWYSELKRVEISRRPGGQLRLPI